MNSFIDHIARHLLQHHSQHLERMAVVFPSRRAGLYLRKSLSELIKKPILMPQVLSIEDFIYQLTGYTPIEPVYLQFELYDIYRRETKQQVQPFTDFIQWGEVVLKEFNELDLALADPDQLFSYLNETKVLTLWNLDQSPLTPFQENYLRFYNSLAGLYHGLRKSLISKRKPYQGLAYRLLAEKWQESPIELPWDGVVMAGFNALTKAEEVIFKKLAVENKAELFWDWDDSYVDDPVQEAGHFIRQNRKVFQPFRGPDDTDTFKKITKEIEVIGVPQKVGQARIAGNILQKLSDEIDLSTNTAVILNDESLTIPLLNSLPDHIGKFNVTMGLPLQQTPVALLIHKILDLQENALKLRTSPTGKLRFYYKDVLSVVENPYFQMLLSGSDIQLTRPLDEIRKSNRVLIDAGDLITVQKTDLFSYEGANLSLVFGDWKNDARQANHAIRALLGKLKEMLSTDHSSEPGPSLDLEYLFHISKVLNTIDAMVESYDFVNDLKTFRLIYSQVIRTLKLPFYGEPLQGVQVMGMLESRTLDFDNIILLSVNEGHLPAGKSGNSFIPLDIKKEFGIPVYDEHNAVVAYHFYRLLQRARRVYLLYNTEADVLGGGDKSRFIMQLLHELPAKSPGSKISEQVVNLSSGLAALDKPVIVHKNEPIINRLRKLAEKGFSASALNTYRRCSLQFYLQYVEGIREIEEAEETIESSTLGTVIHDVLQYLYKPYIGLELTETALHNMKKIAGKVIRQSFEKNYPGGDIDHGKNLLIVKVAETYVGNFLNSELQNARSLLKQGRKVRIKHLEKYFDVPHVISTQNGEFEVRLKGIFDRVDQVNGTTRIIDYKTGRVEPTDLKFKEWDALLDDPALDKSFQVLFYKFLYGREHSTAPAVESGIISLRNLSQGFMAIHEPDGGTRETGTDPFEEVLDKIVSSIFDLQQPFAQTENTDVCTYCAFKSLCNRN